MRLSADLLSTSDGEQQQLSLVIHSATETSEEERRLDEEVGADCGEALMSGAGEELCITVRRLCHSTASPADPALYWSAAEYSAELDELTGRMERHRMQPAMQHFTRALAAVALDTATLPSERLLHIECLSPSLSLRLTPLPPSSIDLHASPLLHSLLSRGPALSFASPSSTAHCGYLTLTSSHQIRLVSLPSDVLSLPLLGVYSCSPPRSQSMFVQCLHFLYSSAISRLTVAPLTFLLLSFHNQRAQLYEVSASMDEVAIEHCEADIALSTTSPQQLTSSLRSLSCDRIRQLWGDNEGVGDGSPPSMSASIATTETVATAADSGSRSGGSHGGRDAGSWCGVYSDGESELGDEEEPCSPLSLRSPSPLPISAPKPTQQKQQRRQQQQQQQQQQQHKRTIHQQHNETTAATKTEEKRKANAPSGKENVHYVGSNGRVAARGAAAAAGHLSRAKRAVASRADATPRVDTNKLHTVTRRMKERRAAEMAAPRLASAAAVAAAETKSAAKSNSTTQHRGQQTTHNAATVNSPASEPQASRVIQRTAAVRQVVVRVDDTRSECETEERRKDTQLETKERMERRQQRATRHSTAPQISSSHRNTAATRHTRTPHVTHASMAVFSHHSVPQSITLPQSLEPIPLLLSSSSNNPHSFAADSASAISQTSLSAALQLLHLLVQAASHLQQPPKETKRASGNEKAAELQLTAALEPQSACSPPRCEGTLTELGAVQRPESIAVETETPADVSEGAIRRSELSNERVVGTAIAVNASAPPPSPSSAAQRHADGTKEQADERSLDQQQCCNEGATSQEDDAQREWEHGEQKYPLSPHSPPADERCSTHSQPDTPLSPTELGARGQSQCAESLPAPPRQLDLSAASTRSSSPSPSHSSSCCSSNQQCTDESSDDDWRAPLTSLSSLSALQSRAVRMSSAHFSPIQQSVSVSFPPTSASNDRSLLALGIPRIDAAGVATSSLSYALSTGSNDDEDEEEETLLSKYDDGRNRKRTRVRGRRS